MDRADATALIEKYKAEAEAEVTASYAKELFGFIIGYSLSGSRRALMEQMEREASNACEWPCFDASRRGPYFFCHSRLFYRPLAPSALSLSGCACTS